MNLPSMCRAAAVAFVVLAQSACGGARNESGSDTPTESAPPPAYTIGGTVRGLTRGQTLTLQDNGADAATVTAGGTGTDNFVFAATVPRQGSYAVTVAGQPANRFCTVTAGSGTDVESDVSSVDVACPTAWYVSGTGDDKHDGTTPATAFRTLNRANALLKPGHVVLAMDGTYSNPTGGAVLGIAIAGTPDAWITYRAYPGAKPVVQTDGDWNGIWIGPTAAYVEVNGFTVVGNNLSLTLAGAQLVQTDPAHNPKYNGNCIGVLANRFTGPYPHHIRILNNTISECPGAGIGTVAADYVTISGNTIYNTSYYSAYGPSGISTLIDYDSNPADTTTSYKMVITDNVVYGNQEFIPWTKDGKVDDGEGIIIDSNHNSSYDTSLPFPAYTGRTLIANNVIYANGSSAIEIYQSSHVDVVNNSTFGNIVTPSGPSAALARISGRGEMNLGHATDVKVYNNIFVSRSDQNPYMQGTACTDCSVDYNLYFGGPNVWNGFGANGPHDKVGDPLYLNSDLSKPESVNLKVAAGSPAIGAGSSLLAPATDIGGNKRAAPNGMSMGAYAQ